jgi:Flp pilus assembly protein TadD
MIEKGDLKRAQKLLKEALKLNPNDAGARHEPDYIKGLN